MTVDQHAPSDRELLTDVGAGDRGALHELFLRHQLKSPSHREHAPWAEAVLLGVEHGDVGLAMERLSSEPLAAV